MCCCNNSPSTVPSSIELKEKCPTLPLEKMLATSCWYLCLVWERETLRSSGHCAEVEEEEEEEGGEEEQKEKEVEGGGGE